MSAWLLLHGFTGAPESFQQVTSGVTTERWLAPRLTGHGPAPFPAAGDFDAEVNRLSQLLQLSFTEPVRLLGYSLGARLALGLLTRYPERFVDAILVGVNPGLRTVQQRAKRRAEDARLVALIRERGARQFLEYWQALPLFASQRLLAAELLAAQQHLRSVHSGAGLCLALSALGLGSMPSHWDALPELDLPIHLVVGELDAKFESLAHGMLQLLPQGRLWQAPQVGHNVVLEAPQFMQKLMLEWTAQR